MPKEGDGTEGFDTGGGLEQVDGIGQQNYMPSWVVPYQHSVVPGVRPSYFKFYKAPGTGVVR
jgi:hypothetical protein